MDEAVARGFIGLPTKDLTAQLTGQVERAVQDGYRGLRLSGVYPGVGVGPHELALDGLVQAFPLTLLCQYFRVDLTFPEVEQVRALHGREVIDTAVFDDGSLRITHPRAGWLRLAGLWYAETTMRRSTVVTDAAAAGDRDLDLASVQVHRTRRNPRFADRNPRRLAITAGPHQMVRRLATLLANHQWPGTDDHIDD